MSYAEAVADARELVNALPQAPSPVVAPADEVLATITSGDVEVIYDTGPDGSPVSDFEYGMALAVLLHHEVVLVNDSWWRDDLNEADRKRVAPFVNCSDVFAWACADAEPLPLDRLEDLYRMWRRDPVWGPAVWCCQQRREMPQRPVEERIAKAGIWELASMSLGENQYDKLCRDRRVAKEVNA